MQDILIVEDGVRERERLVEVFTEAGYGVRSAESVEEAERHLQLEHYRLVVLDIGLGDRSGSHLFSRLKQADTKPFIIIFTGNPSLHLKQRFLDEGAAAYVVKASKEAEAGPFLELVQGLLGSQAASSVHGIPLEDFLRMYVTDASRELFLDPTGSVPECVQCGSSQWIVGFSHRTQLPPVVEGSVQCAVCKSEMNPTLE